MAGQPDAGLASYVPARVVRHYAEHVKLHDAPHDAPHAAAYAERFPAAVLLADICGFTALTESLARRGAVGAEELTRLLNLYLGRLIDLIVEHGGDVIKFAGDAMLVLWSAEDEDLATSTCRAAQCGLAAQERLHDFQATADIRLSLRIGMCAGPVSMIHVGGVHDRWEIVVTGEPLAGMSAANAQAKPGEVAISPAAWALVQDRMIGEALPTGVVCIQTVRDPVTPRPAAPMPDADPRALIAYVQPAVVDHMERGRSGWIAELRRVTVLFVNFPGLTPATPLDRAQAVMRELQTILYRYEGTINKISLDDKGASLVAALGLPPLSHEDDPVRAVRTALAIRDRLAPMQVRHSTGIATGSAFCGAVGNTTRREYTMIGDVVNLAARLMQAAKGGILCDRATYEASRARLAFEALPSIYVKGKAGEIAVYHPTDALADAGGGRVAPAAETGEIVGRVAERKAIEDALRALAERGEGSVIVLEGMAGIGKSRLIEEVRRHCRRNGLECLQGGGDAMERSTAYYAWRGVFEQWLGLDPTATAEQRETRVTIRLAEVFRPEWTDLLPLLNPVLRTTFAPTETTSSMNERARAAATHELLSDLLVAMSHEGSREAVVLDDAHWMDSASVALVSRICQRHEPLVMVLSGRPLPGPAFDEIKGLVEGGARRFQLGPLTGDEVTGIACRSLGVSRLSDAVAGVIRAKAEGNPLLIQELAFAMRDAGLIEIADGECRVAPGVGDLRAVDLPDSIQGAVMARMDRLSASQRLLLKVASVVGRVFETEVLMRLLPGDADSESVLEDIRALEAMRITPLERSDPTPAYAFGHLVFQEVNYRLMLFSQRRQLHRAMAELLEDRHAADLAAVYPLLATHWNKAVEGADAEPEHLQKAIDFQQKAGEQALQNFANHEAVEFLSGALRLIERLPQSLARSRQELALCCTIGAPLLVSKGFAAPETERAYERASQLCQEIENSPEQFGAVYGLWSFALMKTQLSRAKVLAAEVFRVAEASGDPELLLPGYRAVGDTAFWLGDLTTARTNLEHAKAIYRPEQHAREVFRSGQDQGVVSSALSCWAVWLLGYPDTAIARMKDTLALAERLSHPHTVAMTIQNLTMTHQFRGEIQPILEKSDAQTALSREQGFPLWLAGASVMRGWARSRIGRPDDGIAEMLRGIDGWRSTGAELGVPYYFGLLAGLHGAAGRPDAGLQAIADALASSDRSGERWWLPELWRLEGELRLKLPQPDEAAAEKRFLEALELARSQRSRSLELRAAASLYRLWRKQGKPVAEARRPLEDVFGWFTEGQDTADLKEAAELLNS